jgi:hypothetical protein
MSHSHNRNNDNNGFEHHYQSYLSHKNEPGDEGLHSRALAEVDAEPLRARFYEKRRFRRTARRLRRYAI